MERRSQSRRPSRVHVHFWEQGSEKRAMGYTVNVSDTGMYFTTNRLLPRGTRIRTELRTGDGRAAMVEAVVARAERSMNHIRPDGMGVRFLTAREVMGEVAPEGTRETPSVRATSANGVYSLRFADRQQFLAAYHRDLATGGLFIPSDRPAQLNETVTVELQVAEASPLRLQARVVHCFTPRAGNGMAGMGVEVLNLPRTLEALKGLAASLKPAN